MSNKSSNILVSKLGTRYENVYYYKQKIVNWEFTAPSLYELLFSTPDKTQVITSSISTNLKSIYNYINVSKSSYITEESYRNNIIFFNITITNITSPVIPMLLKTYVTMTSDSETIEDNVNYTLNSSTPYTENNKAIQLKNNIELPLSSEIETEIFTNFPKGTYKKKFTFEDSSYNLVLDTKGIEKRNALTSSISTILTTSRDIINASIFNDSLDIEFQENTLFSSLALSGDVLPIETKVCSNQLTVYIQNIDIDESTLRSTISMSLSSYSTIVV